MKKIGIGVSMPRHDAVQQVTGKSLYGADIDMPGMLWCKILRSDRVSAKILSVDTSKAEALPGVVAVVTAKDVPFNEYGVTHIDQPFFASTVVRQYSDVIAAVAAETEEIAAEALGLIIVEYENLPSITDPFEAMKEESYKIHGNGSNIAVHKKIVSGDVEKGFSESKYIIEQDLSTPGIEHCSIETHNAIAYVDDASDDLIVRSSVQKPFELATDLAKMLKRPISSIRVIAAAIGGGFGGKNEPSMEPSIVLLTLKTGRPVKCEYTREEEFNATTIRHPYFINYKTGISEDGKILARQVRIISDSGPYVSWGASTLTKASIHSCGPYDIPNMKIDGYLVYTNNPVGGAMRGFGVTQLGFAYEAHTEYCARTIGMESLEFRRKNLIHDGSVLPTAMDMNIVTIEACLDLAIELAKKEGDWK